MNRPTPVLPGPVSARRHISTGFTLIEMLVSLAITMIMMGAVVSLFGIISDSVSGSRSIIEMSERLRAARNRLQTDLQGATADMRPPLRPEADQGYFEMIEGPMYDGYWTSSATASVMGDVDDVLMFTTRSRGEPFVGKYQGSLTIESQTAEVIYFCGPTVDGAGNQAGAVIDVTSTPLVRTFTLYRRVLLVSPGLAASMGPRSNSFYSDNDLSARFVDLPSPMLPNSLGDLTKRENRFAHVPSTGIPSGFPFDVTTNPSAVPGNWPRENAVLAGLGTVVTTARYGDDVLLTNVLSFDVQVYDPEVPLKSNGAGGVVMTPMDPGYVSAATVVGAGGYANLGWTQSPVTNPPAPFSATANRTVAPQIAAKYLAPLLPVTLPAFPGTSYTYDTWSLHYENNGIDEDDGGSGARDEGSDGLDTDTDGVVDDPGDGTAGNPGEQETQAPFAAPLRGIKITIRVYEPSSKQVRQVTVVQDFLAD